MKQIVPDSRLAIALAFSLVCPLTGPSSAQAEQPRRQDPGNPSELFAKAAAWRALAEVGNARAQFAMGVIHERGEGVERNFVTAVDWYRKAARQGLPEASYNLGNLHLEGRGVGKNPAEAVALFRQAAERGLLPAQFNLAYAYDTGTGVVMDPALAAAWYARAAMGGSDEAQQRLYELRDEGVRPAALPAQVQSSWSPVSLDALEPSVLSEAGADGSPTGTATALPGEAGATPRTSTASRDPQASPGAVPDPIIPAKRAKDSSVRPDAAGKIHLQLGAYGSKQRAAQAWRELAERHATILSALKPALEPVEGTAGPGGLIRLLAGSFQSETAAQATCDALRSEGADCLLRESREPEALSTF